jgi:hypothetical protein
MITKDQVKIIKTLMGKLKHREELRYPDAVISGFSAMSEGHVSRMKMAEAVALIKYLKGLDPDEAVCEKMRRKLFGMAYGHYGLSASASAEEKKGVQEKTKQWVLKYGHFKKQKGNELVHCELNEYRVKELGTLLAQFEKVNREFLESL